MLADIGNFALVLAFLCAIFSVVAAWYGQRTGQVAWVESARNATIVVFPLVFTACLLLVISLLRSDFSIEYVWRVSSIDMPAYLKVTALVGWASGFTAVLELAACGFYGRGHGPQMG